MARNPSGKLKITLPSDTEILMTRVFEAPRHLVFEAMTKPEYIRRWWGCMDGFSMPVCEVDFRVGGKYRFVGRGPDGVEIGFSGEYKEIVVPSKVVNTEIFDPFPDAAALCTMTLEERDGRTYYQTLVQHDTKEARDGHVNSGMEYGAGLGLDKIEEIAQHLASVGSPSAASLTART
jgi:uncharacterized protein YndB with AHSA1/START domain